MDDDNIYFLVRKKAVPQVLLRVVKAKKLLETRKALTVQEAIERAGVSRSSFYKYQDDIMEFHDHVRGMTITLTVQMDDEPGLLSEVLKAVADYGANILTIHQSIPVNGTASLSLSIQIPKEAGNINNLLENMEMIKGVHYVKVLAKE